MLADEYFAQCIMRDRRAEDHKRAALAALRRQSSCGLPREGIGRRLMELVGSLVNRRERTASKPRRGATALPASRSAR